MLKKKEDKNNKDVGQSIKFDQKSSLKHLSQVK